MRSATRANKIFSTVPRIERPRSTFTRTSDIKTTMLGGTLVPVYWDEVLPGDTHNLRATFFARLATPIVPIMDNAYFETFWFYCTNRILWPNFVKQQGEQDNPGDSTNYLTPILSNFSAATQVPMSLYDYFGHPVVTSPFVTLPTITSLHMRMYNKTWNEWFRDQDLQNSVPVPTGDGPDDYSATFNILRVNKYHDFFTSCRPSPQKGTAPTLNISGTGVVNSQATGVTIVTNGLAPTFNSNTLNNPQLANANLQVTGSGTTTKFSQTAGANDKNVTFGNQSGLKLPDNTQIGTVLGSSFTGVTLNAFRELVVVQRVFEADMRGGTRYNEGVYVHFGVVNPDNRVNKVLFLGYGKSTVNIQQVAQTSETDGTPQGNLAAYGTISAHNHGFFQGFTEHGIILGLATVRADLHYQQNLEKMFSRRTRFDYYTPEFANLGEQAVLNQEINYTGNSATDSAVFGYQERWAEYRYKNSMITGLMRSIWPTSLDIWHLAQDFGGVTPTLNSAFVTEDAPWDRVVAVPSEPTFIVNGYVENKTTRVMPVRSIPGLTRI